jgi:predicted PurR-regulated permease PerM
MADKKSSLLRLNRWVALLAVTGLGIYLCWKVVEPFIGVLLLGIALATVLAPLHLKIRRRVKSEVLAAGLSTVITILLFIVPFTFAIWIIANEVPSAVNAVRDGIVTLQEKLQAEAASGQATWYNKLRETLKLDEWLTPAKLKQYASELTTKAPTLLSGVAGGLFWILRTLLSFVFLIFVLFFLYRDGEKLTKRLVEMLPMAGDQAQALVKRTADVLNACVYGVLMVAAVQGTLGGLTFFFLGISGAAIWGIIMMLFCTLPIVGAWVVWMPAAIGLALHGDYQKAIILALVGQFVISTIDGFLRPFLVGQRAKLHELVIFFSVLGGLKYFGLLGILMGPVVMALTYGLLSVVMKAASSKDMENGEVSPAEVLIDSP